MSDEGSSLNEKRDCKARNKHRKSLTSGALCRGFLGLKMCRLWVSSSPRDLQRWWWGYSNNKNRKRSELAKDRLSAKCFQFVSVFVYSWGDHGPRGDLSWIFPHPIFSSFTWSPTKTKMTKGKSTMNEDVFPIEHGVCPICHISF